MGGEVLTTTSLDNVLCIFLFLPFHKKKTQGQRTELEIEKTENSGRNIVGLDIMNMLVYP